MAETLPVIPPIDLPGAGNPGRHYLFLDGVRGFASVYVAIFHLLPWPAPVPHVVNLGLWTFKFAHSAVTLFIVLSGFSLMLPVVHSPDGRLRGGFGGYLSRRALRILPPYYAALSLSITVSYLCRAMPPAHVPRIIAAHALLVHNWFDETIGQFNIAHWSVAAEWQIYFLFPWVLLPCWRRGGRAVPLIVAAIFAMVVVVLSPVESGPVLTCPWYVMVFAIGMVAATFDRPASARSIGRAAPWVAICTAPVYILMFHSQHRGPAYAWLEFGKDVLSGVVMAGFIVRYRSFVADGIASPVLAFFESRPLRALGAMSYSLYLTHGCIVLGVDYWSHAYRIPDRARFVAGLGMGLPAAVGLAFVFSRCFERPFVRSPIRRAASAAP